jgi:hypothetical protein
MVDKNAAKAYVRLHRQRAKSRMCDVEDSALESKLARTFADDLDIYHGLNTRRTHSGERPGQRDDENRSCVYGKMLPV